MFSLIPSLRVQALCHRCGMSALRYWPLNKFPQVWIHIVHLQDPALFCFSKSLLSFLPLLVFICKKLILLGCYNKTCCHLHKFTALCAVSHLLVGYKFPLPTPIAGTTSSNFEYVKSSSGPNFRGLLYTVVQELRRRIGRMTGIKKMWSLQIDAKVRDILPSAALAAQYLPLGLIH